jgi:SAM-dependent methyltransferase
LELLKRLYNERRKFSGAVLTHVVEHCDGATTMALIAACARVLEPGGRLLIATPNARNLIVLEETFWLDPTHVRPYPRALLERNDETMNLIQMYEDLANDLVGDGSVIAAPPPAISGLAGGLNYRQPEPPPVVDPERRGHISEIQAPVALRSLSATSALSVAPEAPVESIDEIFEKVRTEAPTRLEVLAPGFTKPMVFHVDAYKSEVQGVAGLTFSQWGDRSKVFGRTSYMPGKPYDIAADIEEFSESQRQIFKSRQQPVRNNAPAPTPFPTNFTKSSVAECAGEIF